MADPRDELTSRDVTRRAEAVRRVGADGGVSDIDGLIDMALEDRSPSVRLYAAAAAADLACRHRDAVDATTARTLLDRVKRVDPGQNPGLVILYAAWPDRRSLDRLGRLIRDPRSEVRTAAGMAVRRAALSITAHGETHIRHRVAAWLAGSKLPPDAVLDMLKLIGEAGWTGLDSEIDRAARGGRQHGPAAGVVREQLAARRDADGWDGLWVSAGVDTMAPAPDTIADWRVIARGEVHSAAGPELLHVGPPTTIGGRPARWIVSPPVGATAARDALQVDGATFWRVPEGERVAMAAELVDDLPPEAAAALATLLPQEGVVARRVVARLHLAAEDPAGAVVILDELASAKRPKAEVWFLLGVARNALGDTAGARTALQTFLENAAKRAASRGEAEAILAGLD